MKSEIRCPVYACGLGVTDVGYVVDVLHGVLLAPDHALTDETGASWTGEEAFGPDGEGAPFSAEDPRDLGGALDLGIVETEGYAFSNALFRI